MPGKGTTIRSVRIPDDLWDAARQKADAEGTNVSAVVLKTLQKYVTSSPSS